MTSGLDKIIWIDTDATWAYQVLKEYLLYGKSTGMDYLTLGSLRYDERYFFGYIFNSENGYPIELVSYIQYKKNKNKLIINYLETCDKFRGHGIASIAIENFASRVALDEHMQIDVTKLSHDGKLARLDYKFRKVYNKEVNEVSKRCFK